MRGFLLFDFRVFPLLFYKKWKLIYDFKDLYLNKLFQISFFIGLIVVEYFTTRTLNTYIVESMWNILILFVSFFALYILLNVSFKIFTTLGKVSMLLVFALQIEIVQHFIPNRYFSLLDILAEGIGILVAIGVINFYDKYIKVKDTSYIRL